MHRIESMRKIRAAESDVRHLIWDIKAWSCFWEQIQAVDILYDDGIHQDFIMSLSWQNRDSSIRTVRFRDQNGNIHFFSPQPPSPTTVHRGLWKLVASEDGTTALTAMRWFEMPIQEKENLETHSQHLKTFSEDFQTRLETLLGRLGAVCEK